MTARGRSRDGTFIFKLHDGQQSVVLEEVEVRGRDASRACLRLDDVIEHKDPLPRIRPLKFFVFNVGVQPDIVDIDACCLNVLGLLVQVHLRWTLRLLVLLGSRPSVHVLLQLLDKLLGLTPLRNYAV